MDFHFNAEYFNLLYFIGYFSTYELFYYLLVLQQRLLLAHFYHAQVLNLNLMVL